MTWKRVSRRGGLKRGGFIRWHQGDSGIVELEKVGYFWDLVRRQDGAKWRRRTEQVLVALLCP